MCAAQDGHTKVMEELLQYGASVDLKINVSVCSIAALLVTVVKCSLSLFHFLVSCGD